jgi:hypothetical protein
LVPLDAEKFPEKLTIFFVPWPMELKLRGLRPRVTPCVQEEGRI